jgi:hypothetical protein
MAKVPTRTCYIHHTYPYSLACLVKSQYHLYFSSGIQLFHKSVFLYFGYWHNGSSFISVPHSSLVVIFSSAIQNFQDFWIHDIEASSHKTINYLIPTPFYVPFVSVTMEICEALQLRISKRSQQRAWRHPWFRNYRIFFYFNRNNIKMEWVGVAQSV